MENDGMPTGQVMRGPIGDKPSNYFAPLNPHNTWVLVRILCPTCHGRQEVLAATHEGQMRFVFGLTGSEVRSISDSGKSDIGFQNSIPCPTCRDHDGKGRSQWGGGWVDQWVTLAHLADQVEEAVHGAHE